MGDGVTRGSKHSRRVFVSPSPRHLVSVSPPLSLGLCSLRFRAFLLHVLPHCGNMPRTALIGPLLKPYRGLLEVREHMWFVKCLSELRHHGLQLLPNAEKLAAC